MNAYKFFAATVLMATMAGCGTNKKDNFAIDNSGFKAKYHSGDRLTVPLINKEGLEIDSVAWFLNDKRIGQNKGEAYNVGLDGQPFGYQLIKAIIYAEGGAEGITAEGKVELVPSVAPKVQSYTVVNTYPHDPEAFTEGLEFYRDTLIESTGQKGKSWIRKFDYKTGKSYKQADLGLEYFGEGITVIGGKVYQLTWQEKTGFIYDANTLKPIGKFAYDKQIEGWGMTNDGTHIYHSDGTEKIWKMDPATQKMVSFVNVYAGNRKIQSVNELEWANGRIYGNVWQKDAVAVIDPSTGTVERIIDFSKLRKDVTSPKAEVLNGIAYNPKTKTFFVTGKNWDKMFEVRLGE